MVPTGNLTATQALPRANDGLHKRSTSYFANRITEERTTQQDDLKSDLRCLIEGTVKCKRPKPPSTKETREEAFGRYMKIIFNVPHNIKVDFDEDSDEITFEPEPFVITPYFAPKVEVKDSTHPPVIIPVSEKKKKKRKEKKTDTVEEELELEPPPPPPPPPRPVIHDTPAIVKEEIILPEIPTSSPEFLREFINKEWFKQLYPDKEIIPSGLCPDAFFLQLSDYLCTCDNLFKPEILSALETLHRRKHLQNIDQLYQKLLSTVPKNVKPNMNVGEQAVLIQLLNLLLYLKSVNEDFMKTLLTLAAFKDLGLREKMLQMLKSLGVEEAEEWLQPELESWESELLNKGNVWRSLYESADSWLSLWTSKYKYQSRDLFFRSAEKLTSPSFTPVDVVNYFCSVQKEEYLKDKAAPRTNNTVVLPHDRLTGPIHRLGETYTMDRTRKPSNLILPPLRDRPFLMDFPKYLSFPLPRVKLSPFYTDTEEDRLKFLDHRYYILVKSHVEYYR